MAITRINRFQAADENSTPLKNLLEQLVPIIKNIDGCIDCQLLCHYHDCDQFLMIETWQSIEAHQQAIKHIPQHQLKSAMQLLGAPPKGDYYYIS